MSITERANILSGLHKVNADLGVLYTHCLYARALTTGLSVQTAQNEIIMCIEELEKDSATKTPPEIRMATPIN